MGRAAGHRKYAAWILTRISGGEMKMVSPGFSDSVSFHRHFHWSYSKFAVVLLIDDLYGATVSNTMAITCGKATWLWKITNYKRKIIYIRLHFPELCGITREYHNLCYCFGERPMFGAGGSEK